MNFKANDLFIEWYRPFDSTPTDDLIKSRRNGIIEVLKQVEHDFWLDLVRIYYGIAPKNEENLNLIITKFREADQFFPISNNEKLIQMLAGAVLAFQLEQDEDRSWNEFLSLAILSVNFFEQLHPYAKINLKQLALKNIMTEPEDEVSQEDLEALDELKDKLDDEGEVKIETLENLVIVNLLKSSLNMNNKLAEEINVLWWILGEKSHVADDYFQQIPFPAAIIALAKDLSDLSETSNAFPAAESLLNKALTIASKNKSVKKISVYDSINSLNDSLKNKILSFELDKISEFTPCLFGLKKSMEFDKDDDWSSSYKKQNYKAEIKQQFAPSKLAHQFYMELMFIKTL